MSGGGSAGMSAGGVSGGGAGGAAAGMSGGGAGGASGGMSGAAGSSGAAGAGGAGPGSPPAKQSLIWIWLDYKNSIAAVVKNAKSFTHVSPALYQLNYAYTSGTAKWVGDQDNFSGMTSTAMVAAVHAAGLKITPLMYAGAGNGGTDQGIQNVISDNPAGTQKNFINAMVAESVAKGYDGINLDWEVQGTNYDPYGPKLVSFLTAYSTAMHAHNMVVSYDLGGWFTRQCGDNSGLVDLTKLGSAVDQMIMEDYSGTFGNPAKSCPATNAPSVNCDNDFIGELTVMCNMQKQYANIGLISPDGGSGGTNKFAVDALNAISAYGFTSVSLWPDSGSFINSSGVQNGSDWYKVLADWLAKK